MFRFFKVFKHLSIPIKRIKVIQKIRVYDTPNNSFDHHLHYFLDDNTLVSNIHEFDNIKIKEIENTLYDLLKNNNSHFYYERDDQIQLFENRLYMIEVYNYYNLDYVKEIIHEENNDMYIMHHSKYKYRFINNSKEYKKDIIAYSRFDRKKY